MRHYFQEDDRRDNPQEQVFSVFNRIKDALRSRLKIDTIDQLLKITYKKIPLEELNFSAAAEIFLAEGEEFRPSFIHGEIDGYLRLITVLHSSDHNFAQTVGLLCFESAREIELPSGIRTD